MKKCLAYILIVFVLALLTGCGSNEVYDLDNSIYSEVDVDEQGGIDKVLPNGFRVTAEAGTFANEKSIRLIITEEEGAASISKDYLKQVSRIYGGLVNNCFVECSNIDSYEHSGGVVSSNLGYITNCYAANVNFLFKNFWTKMELSTLILQSNKSRRFYGKYKSSNTLFF